MPTAYFAVAATAVAATTNPAASCIAVWFCFCKKRRLSPTRNALAAFAVLNGRPLIQTARSFVNEPTERSEKSGLLREEAPTERA